LQWSPDGTKLALAGSDTFIFDGETGQQITVFDDEAFSTTFLGWSSDGSELLQITSRGVVSIYDVIQQQIKKEFDTEHISDQVSGMQWDSDNSHLFIATEHGVIQSWEIENPPDEE
jgi:WD40 repeat protein